jgi:hypothetical protein
MRRESDLPVLTPAAYAHARGDVKVAAAVDIALGVGLRYILHVAAAPRLDTGGADRWN